MCVAAVRVCAQAVYESHDRRWWLYYAVTAETLGSCGPTAGLYRHTQALFFS